MVSAHGLARLIGYTAAIAIFFMGMTVIGRAHFSHRFSTAVTVVPDIASGFDRHFKTCFSGIRENNWLSAAIYHYSGAG
ncbi:hypothetical protein J8A59_004609 [Salmonella enterica subsp. enterica serovar Java]|nr:hypothetical protein [Salmonella enterica subsp. enterica serovar Java]